MGHLSTSALRGSLILITLLPFTFGTPFIDLGFGGSNDIRPQGDNGVGFDASVGASKSVHGPFGTGFDASIGASKSAHLGGGVDNLGAAPVQRPNIIIFDTPPTTERPIVIVSSPIQNSPQPQPILQAAPINRPILQAPINPGPIVQAPVPCAHPAPVLQQPIRRPGPGPSRHYRGVDQSGSAPYVAVATPALEDELEPVGLDNFDDGALYARSAPEFEHQKMEVQNETDKNSSTVKRNAQYNLRGGQDNGHQQGQQGYQGLHGQGHQGQYGQQGHQGQYGQQGQQGHQGQYSQQGQFGQQGYGQQGQYGQHGQQVQQGQYAQRQLRHVSVDQLNSTESAKNVTSANETVAADTKHQEHRQFRSVNLDQQGYQGQYVQQGQVHQGQYDQQGQYGQQGQQGDQGQYGQQGQFGQQGQYGQQGQQVQQGQYAQRQLRHVSVEQLNSTEPAKNATTANETVAADTKHQEHRQFRSVNLEQPGAGVKGHHDHPLVNITESVHPDNKTNTANGTTPDRPVSPRLSGLANLYHKVLGN